MVVKLERKRYILTTFYPDAPEKKSLNKALRDKVSELVGQLGLAKSSLHIVDIIENAAIIRSTHKSREIVEAAINLLEIDNKIPSVRYVSGSIKKIKEKLENDYDLIDEK